MGERQKILADLFFSFTKVGLFTFGGGYAMISVIRDMCVEEEAMADRRRNVGCYSDCGVYARPNCHQLRHLCGL